MPIQWLSVWCLKQKVARCEVMESAAVWVGSDFWVAGYFVLAFWSYSISHNERHGGPTCLPCIKHGWEEHIKHPDPKNLAIQNDEELLHVAFCKRHEIIQLQRKVVEIVQNPCRLPIFILCTKSPITYKKAWDVCLLSPKTHQNPHPFPSLVSI